MQPRRVIVGLQIQLVPAGGVQIVHRVILLRGEAEGPIARRVGGNMGLVDAGDREGVDDALVGALHGLGVVLIEGGALLVDHNAILAQGVEADAVEFAGKIIKINKKYKKC